MIERLQDAFRALPPWGVGLLALGGVGLVAGGAYAGYRTYDYVEHDNEFCLSCHLMAEPYELFAQSAHRGLGCKACHKPSFAGRSQMALTQIIENPDSLTGHAEVPNEKCTTCHIDGDPERWESIRTSAGHRVHFESDAEALQGLNCVECHSSSLHQFAATRETCAQSGCHEDATIALGEMGDFTIHCTACHNFSAPVAEGTAVDVALAATMPDQSGCLSCHVMRTLVQMPDDEPHSGACGTCHQPHEQTTPAEAEGSCATAGCHARPDTLTPFHRGLGAGVLDGCLGCHGAHDWEAVGSDCLSCHGDVFDDAGAGVRITASAGAGTRATAGAGHVGVADGPEAGPVGSGAVRFAGAALHVATRSANSERPAQLRDTTFAHAEHRSVECTACHGSGEVHGRVTTTTVADCRSCHHTQPVASDCAACHPPSSAPSGSRSMPRSLSFSVGDPRERDLPFDHEPHAEIGCAECHTGGLALSAAAVDCTACHEDHHAPELRCASCHVQAPEPAHTVRVHVGCSGSGCHTDVPGVLDQVPRTRTFCLTCHQELEDHRPGQECEQCHDLPEPVRGGRVPVG